MRYVSGLLLVSLLVFQVSCLEKTPTACADSSTGSECLDESSQSDWKFLDNGSVSGIGAAAPKLATANSKLYSVWHSSDLKIGLSVYNGDSQTSAHWSTLSSSLNQNPSGQAIFAQAITFNSKLYFSWCESGPGASQIRAAVYNMDDTSPNITLIDGGGAAGLNRNSSHYACYPSMTVFAGKLYLTWIEGSSTYQVRVAVYNGNDAAPGWSFVDGNAATGLNVNTAQGATSPKLEIFNNKLYLIWSESIVSNGNAGHMIHVKVFNGNDGSPLWTSVDQGGLNVNAAEQGSGPKLVSFNSTLFAAWTERAVVSGDPPGKLYVKAFNGNDSSPGWSRADGGQELNVDPNSGAMETHFMVHLGKLYGVWTESNSGTPYLLHTKVFNSDLTSSAWSELSPTSPMNCAGALAAGGPQLLSFNGRLYSTWSGQCAAAGSLHNVETIRFQKYTGSL